MIRSVFRPKWPEWTSTIRFRLTVTYAAWLFLLTALLLGVLYAGVFSSVRTDEVPVVTHSVSVTQTAEGRLDLQRWQRETQYATVTALRNYSLVALPALFVLSLVIGWRQAGRVLRPVRRITDTARDINSTDFSRRIALAGPEDELSRLADTIDGMLDRLETAFTDQRRLLGDASHELRNPLAIIQMNLDAVLARDDVSVNERAQAGRVVGRAVERMDGLVEDLLATSRRDALAFTEVEIDLGEVAVAVCAEYRLLAANRDITLVEQQDAEATVIGDPGALRRALANLLSNAVRVSPDGSTITVHMGSRNGWCWLAVRDEGPGIDPADQERVFDRFWQAVPTAGTTGHSGLGLAIVRQIAEGHGGEVTVKSAPGAGSTFVLWFPEDRFTAVERVARPVGNTLPESLSVVRRAVTPSP
ncbi:Signal transduction histidine kinase [Amycolatopsis marina]|uniref:histidine kinase n=1 Tax=Amycolatopsis marina TaxID=490629 RepID=A0A1I0V810_9PSEU|nr:HAMP domain-containing sensor histidine kinase [Amycolatopsis marina]SFA72203.1 Signal transduction histidine kinase [Amycolatopsis marina]